MTAMYVASSGEHRLPQFVSRSTRGAQMHASHLLPDGRITLQRLLWQGQPGTGTFVSTGRWEKEGRKWREVC